MWVPCHRYAARARFMPFFGKAPRPGGKRKRADPAHTVQRRAGKARKERMVTHMSVKLRERPVVRKAMRTGVPQRLLPLAFQLCAALLGWLGAGAPAAGRPAPSGALLRGGCAHTLRGVRRRGRGGRIRLCAAAGRRRALPGRRGRGGAPARPGRYAPSELCAHGPRHGGGHRILSHPLRPGRGGLCRAAGHPLRRGRSAACAGAVLSSGGLFCRAPAGRNASGRRGARRALLRLYGAAGLPDALHGTGAVRRPRRRRADGAGCCGPRAGGSSRRNGRGRHGGAVRGRTPPTCMPGLASRQAGLPLACSQAAAAR